MTPALDTARRGGGARIGLTLFLIMEAAWIAAAFLLVDSLIAGQTSPLMALVCLSYPVALFTGNVLLTSDRFGTLNRILRGHAGILFYAAAFIAVTAVLALILLPDLRVWPPWADGPVTWILEDTQAHRLVALAAFTLFCWVRGALLVGRQPDAPVIAFGFQIGLSVLLAVFVLSAATEAPWPGGTGLALTFMISGLLALWHVRSSRGARSGRDPLMAILGVTLVLCLGALIWAVTDQRVLDAILYGLNWIWGLIAAFFLWLTSLLPEASYDPMDMPEPDSPGAAAEPPRDQPLFQPMEALRIIFSILFFGGLAVMLGLMLLMNLRDLLAWLRRRRFSTPGLAYDRSRHGLRDTLALLWEGLRKALAAFGARLVAIFTPGGSDGRKPSPVRLLYARVTRELDQRGRPRRPDETPLRYARRLQTHWPTPGGDLTLLTHLYVRDRYGPGETGGGRTARLWKKIRRSLRKVKFHHDPDQTRT